MNTTITKTTVVVGLFNTPQEAESAIRDLQNAGIARDDISLVSRNRSGSYSGTSTGSTDVDTGKATVGEHVAGGAVFGGLGGLLLGLAGLAIPGIGPVVAAGPLAAALTTAGIGAGVGAATGGIIGAIRNAGVPEEHAHLYAEGIRRGGTLVTVHTDHSGANSIEDILNSHGAVDVDERSREYRSSGWSRFDESAGPYDVDDTASMGRSNYSAGGTSTGTRRGTRVYSGTANYSGESDWRQYDSDFQQHFRNTYGSTGATYDSYSPAYQYGYRMANDQRYRGRSWNEVETDLRRDYETSYPGGAWERMKDAIRHGWDKVTGKY
jgi:hypothetical protein